jgi:hypothetical protein
MVCLSYSGRIRVRAFNVEKEEKRGCRTGDVNYLMRENVNIENRETFRISEEKKTKPEKKIGLRKLYHVT